MDEKNRIKIYGERHAGTKYLHRLIVLNLEAKIIPGGEDNQKWYFWKAQEGSPRYEWACDFYFKHNFSTTLGWKHILLPLADQYEKNIFCPENYLFLTITKNPYSWLLSLYRMPFHATEKYCSFEDFLTKPWRTRPRENSPKAFNNPMEMWNKKNEAYLKLRTGRWHVINLTYETLIVDPEAQICRISDTYNIPKKNEVFVNKNEGTSKFSGGKTFADYQNYYLSEKWRNAFTQEQLDIINSSLDEGIMDAFEYAKIHLAVK